MDKLYSLQNGTDIRGVAYKDDKSDLEITLTREDVKNLVRGFATWIIDKDKKETILIEGDIPSPINPPKGCKFHTRCRYCTEICKHVTPVFEEVAPGHRFACHHKLGIYGEKK